MLKFKKKFLKIKKFNTKVENEFMEGFVWDKSGKNISMQKTTFPQKH